jgi:hypothetical protein|tara:strand:- start:6266 stop:11209 length:4944 start_codon:yes stop_codon:yes gene_type:complete
MAEIKNSFLRSKMNKDLDDRLIPNGEYRDAQNISVGRSEDDDIGSLENVMGNVNISNYTNLIGDIIGYLIDEPNNRIFLFITDTDQTALNVLVPTTANCYIASITPSETQTGTANILVSGSFLNFSKSFPITGVNLVENLLFWTDNRNQPRKINVNKTLGYYQHETDISVAKYNPYQTIELYKKIIITDFGGSNNSITLTPTQFGGQKNLSIRKGMKFITNSSTGAQKTSPQEYIYVTNVTDFGVNANQLIELNIAPAQPFINGDVLTFIDTTMTGQNISPSFNDGNFNTWPGDPDYLEERYVRFSYRFRFDDGEYSIMAPFTQIAFIPKQKGYFLGSNANSTPGTATATPTDEIQTYTSSLLEFMENGVQNIELIIPLPDVANKCTPEIGSTYKIDTVDILYKESDALAVKVLETISYSSWNTGAIASLNYYTYNYQSRKPFKTLPEDQTVRVYDKVPVRALAQEVSGNRVIYGNFKDQYTPPETIDYQIGFSTKQTTGKYNNWVEYPNHSVKQNRNYQVGFVLADKFGRQSDVILSSVSSVTGVNETSTVTRGSTVYYPYNTSDTQGTIRDWFGSALQVTVENSISDPNWNQNGPNSTLEYPGLYAKPTGNGTGFNVADTNPPTTGFVKAIVDNSNPYTYIFTLNETDGPTNIPAIGDYLRGEETDYVEVLNVLANIPVTVDTVGNNLGGISITVTSTVGITVGDIITGLTSGNGGAVTQILSATEVYSSLTGSYVGGMPITFTPTGLSNKYTVICDLPISELQYNGTNATSEPKFSYTLNEIGWYSYKVVVKQQEQDYYNVYTGGVLSGYPTLTTPLVPNNQTSALQTTVGHISLIADNINKVPADLVAVGPEQKQFRSSEVLFGRVNNDSPTSNIQHYPGKSSVDPQQMVMHDTSTTIGTATDLQMSYSELDAAGQENLFQVSTNPNVSRISYGDSSNIMGVITTTMKPYLAIYETKPQESLLDIYWESSTQGLISDLNADVAVGFAGITQLTSFTSTLNENQNVSDPVTTVFQAADQNGTNKLVASAVLTCTLEDGTSVVVQNPGSPAVSNAVFELFNTNNGGISNLQIKRSTVAGALFPYVFNSVGGSKINKYIFILELDGSSPISFNVNLANTAPNFGTQMTGVSGSKALTGITVGQLTTGVIMSGSTPNVGTWAQNGKFGETDTTGLKWTMINDDGTALSINNYFTINEATGAISKVSTTVPIGSYTFKITVADAFDNTQNPDLGTGSLNSDSLNSATPVALTIAVGETPVNSGIIGTCVNTTINQSEANGVRTITPSQAATSSNWYACWYLSNQDLNSTASGTLLNDLPSTWLNATYKTGTAFRMGNTNVSSTNPSGIKQQLNQGTAIFQCNLSQLFNQAQPPNPLLSSVLKVSVWHRNPANTSTWTEIADINGNTGANNGYPTLICSDNNNNAVGNPTRTYSQVPLAFDVPGEYAIIYENCSGFGSIESNCPKMVVNCSDLYYNTCVIIPDNPNFNNQYYLSDTTPPSYRYKMSTTDNAGVAGGSNGYLFNVGTAGNFYSNTHYPEYIKQFWGDEGLTQVLAPPSYVNTRPYYGWAIYSSQKSVGADQQWNATNLGGANYSSIWQNYYFSGELTSLGKTEITTQPTTFSAYIQNFNSNSTSTLSSKPLQRISGGSSL